MKSVEGEKGLLRARVHLVGHLLHPANNLGRDLVHILHSVLNKFHLSRLLVDGEAGVSPGLEEIKH